MTAYARGFRSLALTVSSIRRPLVGSPSSRARRAVSARSSRDGSPPRATTSYSRPARSPSWSDWPWSSSTPGHARSPSPPTSVIPTRRPSSWPPRRRRSGKSTCSSTTLRSRRCGRTWRRSSSRPARGVSLKAALDLFPGLGAWVNRRSGVTALMSEVANLRERAREEEREAACVHAVGAGRGDLADPLPLRKRGRWRARRPNGRRAARRSARRRRCRPRSRRRCAVRRHRPGLQEAPRRRRRRSARSRASAGRTGTPSRRGSRRP